MPAVTIVEDHLPRAAIVIHERASAQEKFAAAEMKRYLAKITGAEVEITTAKGHPFEHSIHISRRDHLSDRRLGAEKLQREGFIIAVQGRDLLLVGADDDGVEHAVYAFLERFCGVRWYWPGASGEIIPRKATIQVKDIHLREEPDFQWRHMGPGGPLWGPKDKWEKERELGVSEEHQREVALWERRNRLGGFKIADGHAWIRIIPPEKCGEEHPEWFALVNGKRDNAYHDGKHANQLCTTNREMIDTFVARVREYLDTHDVDAVSISPNDGLGFCECEQCRALDTGDMMELGGEKYPVLTDRIFTFANEVAERIAKTHRDKYLLLLVYSLYVVPPKRVKLRDNIIAQFCMQSAIHWNKDLRGRDYQRLRELSCWSKELGIYEYYINGSWPDLPRLFLPLITDSIRLCHELGFRYYSPQMGSGFAINGLNYYVAARLLWAVQTDIPALLADFYEKCYGPAAPMMQCYYEQLEKAWREAKSLPAFTEQSHYAWYMETFSPEFLTDCQRYLQRAYALADSDEIRQRIGFAQGGFKYVLLTLDAVTKANALEQRGVVLFPLEKAQERWAEIDREEDLRRLLSETVEAWERRGRYIEELKQGYEISYLWVRYTDENRQFNPLKNLYILQGKSS